MKLEDLEPQHAQEQRFFDEPAEEFLFQIDGKTVGNRTLASTILQQFEVALNHERHRGLSGATEPLSNRG